MALVFLNEIVLRFHSRKKNVGLANQQAVRRPHFLNELGSEHDDPCMAERVLERSLIY